MSERLNFKKIMLILFILSIVAAATFLGYKAYKVIIPYHTLANYSVQGEKITTDPAKVDADHAVVWQRFNQLFPAHLHPEIIEFKAIDAEKSDGIDGIMHQIDSEGKTWRLVLDTTTYGASALDRTMIHEFAHLITLRPSQVPRDESRQAKDECEVYFVGEGCPASGSYLDAYFRQFWAGYLLSDQKDEGEDAKTKRFESGDFVTEYAASLPTEDIAEVFAEWVLQDESPTGDSIKEQKLRFFDAYPELVEIRNIVRTRLGK